MKIVEIFTSNTCPQCPNTLSMVRHVVAQIPGIHLVETSISSPQGYMRAMSNDITSVPAIFINGNPAFVGKIPSMQELWQLLSNI